MERTKWPEKKSSQTARQNNQSFASSGFYIPAFLEPFKLTLLQATFCMEFVVDLNITHAAERAGCSKRSAHSQGQAMLKLPKVQNAIKHILAKDIATIQRKFKRIELTQERVLSEIGHIAFFDIRSLFDENGRLRGPETWTEAQGAAIAGLDVTYTLAGETTYKIKLNSKATALDQAAKYLGLFDETWKIEIVEKEQKTKKAELKRLGELDRSELELLASIAKSVRDRTKERVDSSTGPGPDGTGAC